MYKPVPWGSASERCFVRYLLEMTSLDRTSTTVLMWGQRRQMGVSSFGRTPIWEARTEGSAALVPDVALVVLQATRLAAFLCVRGGQGI